MAELLHDLRLSIRLLLSNPGFSATSILTLALGIGANTAIFSVVNGVLLRPAPIEGLESLVVVWETDRNSGTTREPASVPDFLDLRSRSLRLDTVAALMGEELNLTSAASDPVRAAGLQISHELLSLLSVRPMMGRLFDPSEDSVGAPNVALISEDLWERTFSRRPTVLGEVLRLDDIPYTIVGVLPSSADFGILQVLSAAAYARAFADRGGRPEVDVWTPLRPDPTRFPRSTHPIFVLGRLADDATPASAQDEGTTIAADLERAYPENRGRGIHIEPLAEVVFGPVRPALLVLLGGVGLVLLVGCVNVANLLLARGAARDREVAVRSALGAGSGRLARQFLVENLVLTFVGAAAGIASAFALLNALVAIAPGDIPRLATVSIDLPVLAATLVMSSIVGVTFGLVPALQAQQVDVQTTLRGGGRHAGSSRASRLRRALVVAELALAVLLLIGAALLIRSFWKLQHVDPGFRAAQVLKAEYQLPPSRYPANFSLWPNFKEMHGFTSGVLAKAAALPGVETAAVAGNHPLDAGFTNSFVVVGREAEARTWPEISVRRVTPTYFRTIGLAIERGRPLSDTDTTAGPPVAVVNRAAARRFFADRNPIDAEIRFWGAARTIVGVAADEKFHGLPAPPPLAVYLPIAQAPSATGVVLVRTAGDPRSLGPALQKAIREVDPGLAVFGVEPLEDTLARSISQRRFTMLLLGLFAGVALALAGVGIHGVLSYTVTQRTREVGIRMALGARPGRVLARVVGEGVGLATLGLAIGLTGALALTGLLGSLLFGVEPRDTATFVAAPLVLLGVALAASYLPARRATRIDPVSALRTD
jgi:putative ABC transport system permease protein